MSQSKSQSAMEYLMTYGWAVLAIAVALALLYSIGVFNIAPNVATGCIVIEGFSCTAPLLYSNGALVVGVGKIGQSVTITATACTANNSLSGAAFQATPSTSIGSGSVAQLLFQCPLPPNSPIGSIFRGYLWINYTTGGGSSVTSQVAAISVPVSSVGAPPDILVQYSNGLMVGYNASPETNTSRGLLLLNILSNAITKESIQLKSETYAVGSNQILLNGSGGTQTNIKLYGAGEYATKITGYQNAGFFPAISSTISNLSIYNMVYESPSGDNWGNDTMRNVFWSGYVDCVYIKSQPDLGSISLYNDTLTSGFDTFDVLSSESDPITANFMVFDSYLHPISNNSAGQDPGGLVRGVNVQGGIVTLVDDIVNVSTPVGPIGFGAPTSADISTFGGAPSPANILVYGGFLTTGNSVAGTNTIYNPSYPYATIFINASLIYNAVESSGPVSNTLGTYGS